MAGSSYGGHFVPSISAKILKENVLDLNFKGMAIGNAWTNPKEQYPSLASFAYENGLIESKEKFEAYKNEFKDC